MFKLFNQPKSPEAEKQIETKIILEIMRHGKKEKDDMKPNEMLMLTKEGKAQAVARGKKLNPQPEVSLAWGSPRKRTQETAAHVMLANEDIDPNTSLEEMEKAIAKEIKVGKK